MRRDWRTTKANLDPEERELLRDLAAGVAQQWIESVIVNIGIYHSGSMYCLRAGAPQTRLVGVDIRAIYKPKDELKAEFICSASQDCHQDFEGPIVLLFVDGDHHYEAVMSDLLNWGAKVVPGGIMAVHDYYAPGVAEAKYAGKTLSAPAPRGEAGR